MSDLVPKKKGLVPKEHAPSKAKEYKAVLSEAAKEIAKPIEETREKLGALNVTDQPITGADAVRKGLTNIEKHREEVRVFQDVSAGVDDMLTRVLSGIKVRKPGDTEKSRALRPEEIENVLGTVKDTETPKAVGVMENASIYFNELRTKLHEASNLSRSRHDVLQNLKDQLQGSPLCEAVCKFVTDNQGRIEFMYLSRSKEDFERREQELLTLFRKQIVFVLEQHYKAIGIKAPEAMENAIGAKAEAVLIAIFEQEAKRYSRIADRSMEALVGYHIYDHDRELLEGNAEQMSQGLRNINHEDSLVTITFGKRGDVPDNTKYAGTVTYCGAWDKLQEQDPAAKVAIDALMARGEKVIDINVQPVAAIGRFFKDMDATMVLLGSQRVYKDKTRSEFQDVPVEIRGMLGDNVVIVRNGKEEILNPDDAEQLRKAIKDLRPGTQFLMHDDPKYLTAAMQSILDEKGGLNSKMETLAALLQQIDSDVLIKGTMENTKKIPKKWYQIWGKSDTKAEMVNVEIRGNEGDTVDVRVIDQKGWLILKKEYGTDDKELRAMLTKLQTRTVVMEPKKPSATVFLEDIPEQAEIHSTKDAENVRLDNEIVATLNGENEPAASTSPTVRTNEPSANGHEATNDRAGEVQTGAGEAAH